MKKIIALFVCIVFMAGIALATADYFSTNKGSKTGVFTKTKKPMAGYLKFYGLETRAASTEISSGEAVIGVAFDGTTPYLYIIARPTSTTVSYRTIQVGQLATYDAVTLP